MTSLDTLPPELLFHILSFTEPDLNPTLSIPPLNALAETNKQLNAIVEEYARGLLKRHLNTNPHRNSKKSTCRRKWLGERCAFCKKNSKRRACFYVTLVCCSACDKTYFEKMTMTQASQQTHLSKLDLFTPSPLHPELPPLTTGSQFTVSGPATMLSTPEVLERSAYIESLLCAKADDAAIVRVRPATHERIIKHMGIRYEEGAGWLYSGYQAEMWPNGPKSIKTEETRTAYVTKGLRKEREALGLEPVENPMAVIKLRPGQTLDDMGIIHQQC